MIINCAAVVLIELIKNLIHIFWCNRLVEVSQEKAEPIARLANEIG